MKITYKTTGEFLNCYGVSEHNIEDVIERILPDKNSNTLFDSVVCEIGEKKKDFYIIGGTEEVCEGTNMPTFTLTDLSAEEFREITKIYGEVIKRRLGNMILTETVLSPINFNDKYFMLIELTVENVLSYIDNSDSIGYIVKYIDDSHKQIEYVETFNLSSNRKNFGSFKVKLT